VRAPSPPRYKLALITWVGAYVLITLILEVLGPAMARWPLPLRTLLLSAMMVPALTWVVLPALTYLLRGWLVSTSNRSTRAPGAQVQPGSRPITPVAAHPHPRHRG
jgi:antibiotic biosynthesis monooxygenase (ABM) superfamily enzyme